MALVVLVGISVIVQEFRPIPPIAVAANLPNTVRVPGQLQVTWPTQGEAALAVAGEGVMGQSGTSSPLPIASLAKMMTAYLVLQAHPLAQGQDGPTLTVSQQDYQTYVADVANQDSVAPVAVDEKLTEYQLLEALLLPSGDNIATMLANWVSGNTNRFVQEMNATAKHLGMAQSHYADPAGVDPATVSTALDQLKIAETAMQNPIFREIVAMPQAILPIAGIVYNVDYAVGHNGIVGIKTGSTPQDGANFAFASYATVNGKQVLVIGDVLGQYSATSLNTALSEGQSLAAQAKQNLTAWRVTQTGQAVASIQAPWSAAVSASGAGVTLVGWPGMVIKTKITANSLGKSVTGGQAVGQLDVTAGRERIVRPLQSTGSIAAPTFTWRLERTSQTPASK